MDTEFPEFQNQTPPPTLGQLALATLVVAGINAFVNDVVSPVLAVAGKFLAQLLAG